MNKFIEMILNMLVVIVGIVIIGLIIGIPTMILWNWLMPDIFGVKEITFFQAWGLYILAGLLFKSSSSSN